MIDSKSGEVRTAAVLDRELVAEYQITVVAEDQDSMRSNRAEVTLTVRVLDENDNKPIIRNMRRDIFIRDTTEKGIYFNVLIINTKTKFYFKSFFFQKFISSYQPNLKLFFD